MRYSVCFFSCLSLLHLCDGASHMVQHLVEGLYRVRLVPGGQITDTKVAVKVVQDAFEAELISRLEDVDSVEVEGFVDDGQVIYRTCLEWLDIS